MSARFLEYCRLTGGLDPAATMARDEAAYPGGRMAGFVVWLAERRREWEADSGRRVRSDAVVFDAWLAGLEPSEVG